MLRHIKSVISGKLIVHIVDLRWQLRTYVGQRTLAFLTYPLQNLQSCSEPRNLTEYPYGAIRLRPPYTMPHHTTYTSCALNAKNDFLALISVPAWPNRTSLVSLVCHRPSARSWTLLHRWGAANTRGKAHRRRFLLCLGGCQRSMH